MIMVIVVSTSRMIAYVLKLSVGFAHIGKESQLPMNMYMRPGVAEGMHQTTQIAIVLERYMRSAVHSPRIS